MFAERRASPEKDERYAAFITYAHNDDRTGFINDFFEEFNNTRSVQELDRPIFLDKSKNDKFGNVDKYLREHAHKADYLIIFVGEHYPTRDCCLVEWTAFFSQFEKKDEALERLVIVEIDEGAVQDLIDDPNFPENADAAERADILNANFKEDRFLVRDENGEVWRRVARVNGRLDQSFCQIVRKLAKRFTKHYTEKQRQEPTPAFKRVKNGSARPAKVAPPPPTEQAAPVDVIIAPSTPDLAPAIDEIVRELEDSELSVEYIPSDEMVLLTPEQLAPRLQRAEWLVQPFSWHCVYNAETAGGHLFRQPHLFDRPGQTLFWRPDQALIRDDLKGRIERREEHRSIIEQLHFGIPPHDLRGCRVILGNIDDTIREIRPKSGTDNNGGATMPPRVFWETDPDITKQLERAMKLAEERCERLLPSESLRNAPIAPRELIKPTSNWPKDAHGIVLTDYAKDESYLDSQVNEVWDHLAKTERDIPIIVFSADKKRQPQIDKIKSTFIDTQDEKLKIFDEGNFDKFLEEVCRLASQDKQTRARGDDEADLSH